MKTVIIGAGFTGLAASIKTGATIYEATSHAGGICTDYVTDGFRFSNGGPHWIFGKDKGLEYIKSLVEVNEYERKAGVYYNHTFPYPFQQEAQKDVGFSEGVGSFRQWLLQHFGIPQCNLFFFPFNEKYTAGLMDKILSQDEYKSPKTGTGWVSTFCDPVNGLSDLVNKMAEQCTILYNNPAVSIDTHNKIVNFKFGHEKYDRLISTIPLNKCLELCGNTDIKLPYTSVLVINIGGEPGYSMPKEHWLYIPFCKTGFHRVSFYTNVDPSKAPEGKVGLSVEIAYHDKTFEETEPNIKLIQVVEELVSWGWIKSPYVANIDWVPCAYTWQYNKEDVPNALQWLKERDIISTGRYGKWKFQGITQSIEDGFNVEA